MSIFFSLFYPNKFCLYLCFKTGPLTMYSMKGKYSLKDVSLHFKRWSFGINKLLASLKIFFQWLVNSFFSGFLSALLVNKHFLLIILCGDQIFPSARIQSFENLESWNCWLFWWEFSLSSPNLKYYWYLSVFWPLVDISHIREFAPAPPNCHMAWEM